MCKHRGSHSYRAQYGFTSLQSGGGGEETVWGQSGNLDMKPLMEPPLLSQHGRTLREWARMVFIFDLLFNQPTYLDPVHTDVKLN